MMNIKRFVCNMLQENCYVVSDDTKECVIIDCGAYYEEEHKAIERYIHDEGLRPMHLLATHGHLDHNFGNAAIGRAYGLNPEMSEKDAPLIAAAQTQAEAFYGVTLKDIIPAAGHYFTDDEELHFGHHTLKVISSPGHSRGSVCFYCSEEKVLFSGDTLFRHSIGRTDFEGGSMLQIIQSLRSLAQLDDDVTVLPGHGEATTIGEECAHNPYIDR